MKTLDYSFIYIVLTGKTKDLSNVNLVHPGKILGVILIIVSFSVPHFSYELFLHTCKGIISALGYPPVILFRI